MKKQRYARMSVRVPIDLHRAVCKLAKQAEMSRNSVVIAALDRSTDDRANDIESRLCAIEDHLSQLRTIFRISEPAETRRLLASVENKLGELMVAAPSVRYIPGSVPLIGV